MNRHLNELVSLLDNQLASYQSLIDLLNEEKAALLNLDLEKVQETAKTKENAVLKIRLLLPALTESIKETGIILGLPEDPLPTLAELSAAAPQPWSARIRQAGLALARLKRAVARHNEANKSFVQESLQMTSDSIAILTGAVFRQQGGYKSNGQKSASGDYGPTRLSREV